MDMQIRKDQINIAEEDSNLLIVTDGNNGVKVLPAGTTGQYLKSDGTWGIIEVTAPEDIVNEMSIVGVTSDDSTKLKMDTNVTVTNNSIKTDKYKIGSNVTMLYNNNTKCVEFIFN